MSFTEFLKNGGPLGYLLKKGLGVSFRDIFGNVAKKISGSGLTDADKELQKLQYTYNNQLAENDFERKIDFYNQYESPAAQVAQYKAAGLNPALMYQGGASVSASGGVGASGVSGSTAGDSGLMQLLGVITGFAQKQQQIDNEYDLRNQQIGIDRQRLEMQERLNGRLGDYYFAQTENVRQATDITRELFPINKEMLIKQNAYVSEMIKSAEVQRSLDLQGISESKAREALARRQELFLIAQERWGDELTAAQSKLMSAQKELAASMTAGQNISNQYHQRTLEKRVEQATWECNEILLRAANYAKDYEYAGQQNAREWVKIGADVVKTAGTVFGAVYGLRSFGTNIGSMIATPRYQGGNVLLPNIYPQMLQP